MVSMDDFKFSRDDFRLISLILWYINIYGAMAYWFRHWVHNPEVPCSKPLGGSKVDSAFHPFEVDKMSQ